MAVVIFFATQVLKLPIKAIVNKLQQKYEFSDKIKGIINLTIAFIPFGLGLLAEYLYGCVYLKSGFSIFEGLTYGLGSLSIYAFYEKLFAKSSSSDTSNPCTDTEEGKALVDLVENITADGKVDEQDVDAVKAFFDFIKKDEK